MSYTVLARKYRSQTFDEVVGQDHVAQTLKRAIDSDRIAHAFLFCGTRGTGKTSMARILAKSLNCRRSKRPTTEPCGECDSCVAVARGEDMDVIEIDAASNTQVEKTRDAIIDHTAYRPANGRFKVFIIDEVHMLSKASFNALLKTLEEPPEHVKFILATTEPEKVLPTILSRCQRYDFRNIPTREIAAHLKSVCKQEKIKADDEALLLIAKAGCGSMRDALSLLDRLLSVGEKNLGVQTIEQMLGMPRSQVLFDLAQALGSGDVKRALELADQQIPSGMSADTLVAGLTDHLRNLLVLCACGPESELVEAPGVSVHELSEQANRFDAITLSQDIAILEELRRSLRSSGAGRALLDATLVRLALAGQFTSVDELLNRVNGSGGGMSGSSASSRASASSQPALKKNADAVAEVFRAFSPSAATAGERVPVSPCPGAPEGGGDSAPQEEANVGPVSLSDLDGIWRTLLQLLSAKRAGLPQMLQGATLVGIEDGTATIRFAHDDEQLMRMFERNGKKETIGDVISGIVGARVGVQFELAPVPETIAQAEPAPVVTSVRRSSPPPPSTAPTSHDPVRITAEMKQELRKDPLIAAVMDLLGGEPVRVE